MTGKDNGRVPGYDNSHGHHHRHFKGTVETVAFHDYDLILARFILEVDDGQRLNVFRDVQHSHLAKKHLIRCGRSTPLPVYG